MRQIVLILFLFLHLSLMPRANSSSFESEFSHRDHTVRVVFPDELKNSFSFLRRLSQQALMKAEERLGIELDDDVEIYFDIEPLLHNGLTTAIPRNRIFVNIEAPDLNSSIGLSRFYLMETLVHEWAHMLSIQEQRGVFRTLSWVLGHSSRPNGAWPRWIHEGLAVWTEKSVGGRPLSGSVDFDLRRYAEFSRRSERPALNNSLLDGQWELSNFRAGQVPYTFGYLLMEHLSKSPDFSPGAFAKSSSKSLGISFRKSFAEHGVSLDQSFKALSQEWMKTPLSSEKSAGERLSSGTEIRGLQSYASYVAWIESFEDSDLQFVADDGHKKVRRNWPYKLLTPLSITPLEISPQHEHWAVLVESVPAWLENSTHSPTAPARRRLLIFDGASSTIRCHFDLGDRLRELSLSARRILWVKSLDDGRHELREAEWSGSDCGISGETLLLRSEAFERLSAPSLNTRGIVLTRSFPSTTIYDERILDLEGRRLRPLGEARVLTQFSSQASGMGVIFERSPTHWGPLVTRETSSGIEAYRVPLRSGAYEAVVSTDSRWLYYIEKLWDADEVRRVSTSDPSLKKDIVLRWEDEKAPESEPAPTPADNTPLQSHGPLDAIWPHFWIPSLVASEGAWIIAGQTFYSDLTATWSGNSFLGYNTETARALGSTSLSWVPSSRRAWPQLDLHAEYNPRDVSVFGIPGQKVQDRSSGDAAATFVYSFQRRWRGTLSLGYSLEHLGALGNFESRVDHTPFLRLTLRSAYGRRPYTTLARLSETPSFFYFEQKLRSLSSLELQSDLYGLVRTSARTRVLFALEGAHTARENFPQSYFVWGGSPPLGSGYEESYLNRGFPNQGFVARNLVRMSSELIWGAWEPRASLSWNRLRVQNIDLRLVGETLTWDAFTNPAYRMGEQFSSSAGAEVDILGSGLHYISYKLSLGAFRGFGDFADTRFTAQLRVGLDL